MVAVDVLNRAMHPASYRCIAMAIGIASNSPSFSFSPISLSPATAAK
jgi:hypothetical protein